MPCWVVPTLAAEYWRVPLAQVMSGIREGSIVSKTEDGFVFVDVAPGTPLFVPRRLKKEDRPSTFVKLSDEEISALLSDEPQETPALALVEESAIADDKPEPGIDEDDLVPDGEDDNPRVTVHHWTTSRQRTARLRKPPRPLRLSA